MTMLNKNFKRFRSQKVGKHIKIRPSPSKNQRVLVISVQQNQDHEIISGNVYKSDPLILNQDHNQGLNSKSRKDQQGQNTSYT